MNLKEMVEEMTKGRYVVWIDDKEDAKLTPDYMESHFVAIVGSIQEGKTLCDEKQKKEREERGRAVTRYRITGMANDYICSEDLDEDAMRQIMENMKKMRSQ